MAIRRWDPWRDLVAMQNELNRMFERTFSEPQGATKITAWAPAVDMFERDGEIVVRAELPGVKPEDVDVTILEDSLRIHGERKQKEEVKEENFYRMEQRYGSFERVMQLPAKVRADDVKAKFAEGILEITMPKAEEEKPKQIKINVEEEK